MKSLLIIGAGYQQIEAYKVARSLGLFIVSTDQNINAPAFEYADVKLICSTRDPELTLSKVKDYINLGNKIDGVMTIANDVPVTVAKVAKFLNLPSIPLDAAFNAASKSRMKNIWISHNVTSPEFAVAENYLDLLEKVNDFQYPIIIKPVDGRGSKGVFFLENGIDLRTLFEKSISCSEAKKVLIEKYIPGPQLSVESIFIDNVYYPIAFADRNYDRLHEFKPFIVEDGGVLPSKQKIETLNNVSSVVETAARSLGIHWGSVKADIILNDGKVFILELAARLSGNFLATHHIPRAYGVNLVEAVIKLALGEEVNIEDIRQKHLTYLGVRYFFPKTGTIKSISLPHKSDDLFVEFYMAVGDEVPPITNSGITAGYILAEANSYDEALIKAQNFAEKVSIEIE
jgi:biotin carboxylase